MDRSYRKEPFQTDRQRVEHLFVLYEQLSAPLALEKKPKKTRGKSKAPLDQNESSYAP